MCSAVEDSFLQRQKPEKALGEVPLTFHVAMVTEKDLSYCYAAFLHKVFSVNLQPLNDQGPVVRKPINLIRD